MKTSVFINTHKILVTPVVLGMMWYFDNWSVETFVYLAMHGTYTVLWLIKHMLFGDKRFEEKQPLWIGILFIFLPLAGYYAAPFLLTSRHITLPPYMFALILFLYIMGIFLHFVSDAQKYYTLQLRKGLITEGLFSRTRNPNYLGELLIYTAYAMMSMHWLPYIVLGGWVVGFFLRNMLSKDKSLSRYAEFGNYKHKSGLLLPKFDL
jgi:protein-S-isoprenylcysteine O-methyltransferase Ste14